MYYFIAKPLRGRKAKLHEKIKERLDREKIPYVFSVTKDKEESKLLAAKYSAEEDAVVVVVGGDGMLNVVLSGVDPERCTLGLIPAGTGNDFAETAKIPHGLDALDILLKGEPKYTDYLAFSDGRRSLNIAGLGIDVDILTRCERMKHLHAKSKYFLSLLVSLVKFRGIRMKVTANGKSEEGNFLIAAVCNGKQLGGGIRMCPTAVLDDGKAELVYVECPKRHKLLGALIRLMQGKVLSLPITRHVSCEEAELEIAPPFTVQYDGELYETSEFRVKCIHNKLKMYRGNG